MDVSTHTKHDFIHWAPHTHTLPSRIRDFFLALRTAAIRRSSGARRASAPCSFLCCSKLSQLLSWAKLPSPSAERLGCKPNLRLCCPSAACRTHAARQPRRARYRSLCRPQTCEMMGLSPMAAAAALARPRSSCSRFNPTTSAACRQPEERHKVSHGTRRRIRSRSGEGCGSTGMAAHLKIIDMDEVRSTDAVGDRPRHRE